MTAELTPPNPIRVVIVDDHGIVRQGLAALLTRPGIEVVGQGESGLAAVELARDQQPDVMLLDIRMKDLDGLGALPRIKQVAPQTRIIMLTTYANPGYLATAISRGASGYLSKETDPEQIVRAVRAAAAGDELIDRALLAAVLSTAAVEAPPIEEAPNEQPIEPLSEREAEVLTLLVQGCNNQTIAETLSISLPTVKTHIQHILQKLHVSDRTQAALLAVRQRLVVLT